MTQESDETTPMYKGIDFHINESPNTGYTISFWVHSQTEAAEIVDRINSYHKLKEENRQLRDTLLGEQVLSRLCYLKCEKLKETSERQTEGYPHWKNMWKNAEDANIKLLAKYITLKAQNERYKKLLQDAKTVLEFGSNIPLVYAVLARIEAALSKIPEGKP